ncbi:unnamed protein product [Orchesella dallaii]|uniref:Protein SET n=1 Tax=Orchesella dallaii TaxID=48710 RepID=A0ABP1QL42_9HEXA
MVISRPTLKSFGTCFTTNFWLLFAKMSTRGPSSRKIKRVEEGPNGGAGSDAINQQIEKEICQALSDVNSCQKELDKLNDKASNEKNQVESKYNKLRKPYHDKRAAVIERIPEFWANAIITHPQIWMFLDEDDEEEDCLRFLKNLEVEVCDNVVDGFRIKFIFDKNPFFHNAELIKEFHLGPNVEPKKSTSTLIKWKKNVNLSNKLSQINKARMKRGQEKRTFFSWFSDNTDPEGDAIAEVIKNELWSNPLTFYSAPGMEDYDILWEEEDEMMDEESD